METKLEPIRKLATSIVTAATDDKIFTLAATVVSFAVQIIILRRYRRGRQLPSSTFTPNSSAAPQCAVCLHDLAGGESYRKLPKCDHCFHVGCIDAWLRSNPTCPLCRRQVYDHPIPNHLQLLFSYFLSLSQKILGKMSSYVNDELTLAFVQNLRHFS